MELAGVKRQNYETKKPPPLLEKQSNVVKKFRVAGKGGGKQKVQPQREGPRWGLWGPWCKKSQKRTGGMDYTQKGGK